MNSQEELDVLVVGGGCAGITAAAQAGRAGSKVLLVEKTGMLGGTTTNGGVSFPGLFHAWGKQVIAGIGWELVIRCTKECGGILPDFSNYRRSHSQLQIPVSPFVFAALADELVVDSGVKLLFHSMVAGIEPTPSGVGWLVSICTKGGLETVRTKAVIDATGDANVASLAGFPLVIPDEVQPATLSCHAGGYDLTNLDIAALNRAFDEEVRAGRLVYTDVSWNTVGPDIGNWLFKHGNNANHIHQIAARDSQGRSRLERESRQRLLYLYRFLRRQPGLENLTIEFVSPECGVRETATIRGKCTVTVKDYCSGRIWDDAVCQAFYPVDLHQLQGGGLQCEPLAEGVVPTVPRGALLPIGSRYFLVAGRCLSSDRLANSALRVQATCMATGQAAGAMAALSARTGIDPEFLDMAEIRKMLRQHGAIIPNVEKPI